MSLKTFKDFMRAIKVTNEPLLDNLDAYDPVDREQLKKYQPYLIMKSLMRSKDSIKHLMELNALNISYQNMKLVTDNENEIKKLHFDYLRNIYHKK